MRYMPLNCLSYNGSSDVTATCPPGTPALTCLLRAHREALSLQQPVNGLTPGWTRGTPGPSNPQKDRAGGNRGHRPAACPLTWPCFPPVHTHYLSPSELRDAAHGPFLHNGHRHHPCQATDATSHPKHSPGRPLVTEPQTTRRGPRVGWLWNFSIGQVSFNMQI